MSINYVENILKTIDEGIKKSTDKLGRDITSIGKIVSCKGSNKYIVNVNGSYITAVSAIDGLAENEMVRVTIPNNNTANAYISSKLTPISYPSVNPSGKVQSDWNTSDSNNESYIKNKPLLGTASSKNTDYFDKHGEAENALAESKMYTDEKCRGYAEKDDVLKHVTDTSIHITYQEKADVITAVKHSKSDHADPDATVVNGSEQNGNIIINGAETSVYRLPKDVARTDDIPSKLSGFENDTGFQTESEINTYVSENYYNKEFVDAVITSLQESVSGIRQCECNVAASIDYGGFGQDEPNIDLFINMGSF